MFIRKLKECEGIIAGDNTALRELFNPEKNTLELEYSLAHATVKPGQTTRRHRLKSSEVYYILKGEGEMHVDGENARVSEGHAIYIPPLAVQFIRNTGKSDLVFLCIVEPAWKPEDEEIL